MVSVVKIVLLISVLSFCACTSQTPSREAVTASVRKIMPSKFEVVSVVPLKEVPGLIEVSIKMDKQPVVLYMDKTAQYLFSGSLLHVESRRNLTVEAQGRIK
ncbi:MAG: disulfide isomerase DsbC N-terminal domain-containing protein [Desulfuromonadales bacterium]